MPKTVHSDSTKDRINPYITKSINKTLLTPCRQVGLSRKRKTPNSLKSSSANDSSGSIVLNTTPLTSRQSSSDSPDLSQEAKPQPKLDKSSEKVRTKKSVSKCLIVDDIDDTTLVSLKSAESSEKPLDKSVKSSDKVAVKKSGLKRVISDDEDDSGFVGFERLNSSEKAAISIAKSSNKVKVKKPESKHVIVDDEEEREKSSEQVSKVKVKKPKRMIIEDDEEDDVNLASLKKNNSTQKTSPKDSDFETSDLSVIKPKDKLRTYENKKKKTVLAEIQNEVQTKKPEKKVKMKRCLSMKKSSEEMKNHDSDSEDSMVQDCSVFLNPLEAIPKSETAIDVKKLEQEVQEKRKLVEDLQQAEIYRKLHDVDKLQELTATWKSGCISALSDLLLHLQKHADIDMATLLSNLRVPEDLIKLSQNGDLV